MEFWGIEVKAGKPIKAEPGFSHVIHLSQASLGESKNKAESVPLYVNANGQKFVLGTLSHQNCPQLSFDLVFDQEFELSHNWKNGSVYFLGYKTFVPEEGESTDDEFDMSDEESSEQEEEPVAAAENGKAKTDAKTVKAISGKPDSAKQAVKIEKPDNKKTEDDSEDESGSDDEDDLDDESGSEEDSDEMSVDDSDEEDEETPKKVESSKKRPAEAATPVSAKKVKSAATPQPQKSDGKKGGHTATPHPSKQAGKASAKSPKSGGQFSCGSCNKGFNSETGLESHKKAKHGGK